MRKYLPGITAFILAFGILSISFMKSASIRYAFTQASPKPSEKPQRIKVEYQLPYPGKILPDHLLWPMKAGRDKIWQLLSANSIKKAELSILFADKRLLMSKALFEKQKPDLGFSTLTKAEKYLENALGQENDARKNGIDTSSLLIDIAASALKHREIINEILEIAPGDAKPEIITMEGKAIDVYKRTVEILNSKGITAPVNPFDQ